MKDNDPQEGTISNPMVMLSRIYVKLYITMPHNKYRSFGCCGFREEDFLCISIISLWQIMMLRGGTCMDPRGTFSSIYKEDHNTLLHTRYKSPGLCGFREEDCFMFFPL